MSIFDQALDVIEHNRNNRHNCIPYDNKLPRFSEYLPGIEKKNYYLVSGASGAGKSQFTDDFFVFTPYDFVEENDTNIEVEINYFSLELDKVSKMHQWMSRRLYTHYGIRTGIKVLQSIGKNRLNNNMFMAVQETRAYFEKMESKVKLYDGYTTPSRIARAMEYSATSNGQIIYNNVLGSDGLTTKEFSHYKPNNSNKYIIWILDHYSLLSQEGGKSIKHTIEDLSKHFVQARNRYGFIPVPIQQQNSESENLEHFKHSKLLPSKDGLAESKLTYNDCDTAIGIFAPQKHEIKTDRGYNVLEMRDAYRYINLFKGRWGMDNIGVGLYFDGAVNYFAELKKADQMNSSDYEMIKNRKPNW